MSKYLKKLSSMESYTDFISGSDYEKNTVTYITSNNEVDFNDDKYLIVVYNFTEYDVNNYGSKTLWTTYNYSGNFPKILLDNVEVPYNSPKTVKDVGIGIHVIKFKLIIDSHGYLTSSAPLFYNKLFINVYIPSNLLHIPSNLFQDCYFTKLVFPKKLESVDTSAFAINGMIDNPYLIDTLELPSTLINLNPFTLPTVKNLIINSTQLSFSNGLQAVMVFYNKLKTIKISNCINISDGLCTGCTSLTSVTLGDSVTTVGNSAFSGCTSLEEVRILNPNCIIANNAFIGANSNCKVYLGDELIDITQYMNN